MRANNGAAGFVFSSVVTCFGVIDQPADGWWHVRQVRGFEPSAWKNGSDAVDGTGPCVSSVPDVPLALRVINVGVAMAGWASPPAPLAGGAWPASHALIRAASFAAPFAQTGLPCDVTGVGSVDWARA